MVGSNSVCTNLHRHGRWCSAARVFEMAPIHASNSAMPAERSAAQHSTAQPSTAQHRPAQHSTARHSTAWHSIAQHSAPQHSTAQHSVAQHSTIQHSMAQHANLPGQTSNPVPLANSRVIVSKSQCAPACSAIDKFKSQNLLSQFIMMHSAVVHVSIVCLHEPFMALSHT